ncbi:patatin-like phospholipase family protein [Clostridium hydrogeniformans]|uniref:patatin-like phospholipase family protein n=1 Tax=Clostridium hydrogeniformans TaxID=349933 RepID=UPI00068EDFF4|nr:patatin-like phospholipase family protein [Clostridium hydrogeniformans]
MNKLGLVFAGGGGKGAYEVGVWRGLKTFGIDRAVKVVSGTSIGALNAMMFIQGDYNKAEEVWMNSSQEKMLPIDEKIILRNMVYLTRSRNDMEKIVKWAEELKSEGTVSRDGLIDTMEEYLNYEKLKMSNIPCFIACSKVPEMEAEYFKVNNREEDEIKKLLFATTAIPLVFDRVEIGGAYYMDGGIKDNIPIKPVYDEGCNVIIVIYFDREERIDKSLYKDAKIIEIFPKKVSGWLTGTLDFSKEASLDRILDGYRDTLKIFNNIIPNNIEEKDASDILIEKYEDINDNLEKFIIEKTHLEEEIESRLRVFKRLRIINSNLRSIRKSKSTNNIDL